MSENGKYPITLERMFFIRTSVVAVPAHQPSESSPKLTPENSLSVMPQANQPNQFDAHMRTIVNPTMDPQYPYSIDVECIAVLTHDGTLSQEDATRGAWINAHSVLYGAIREAVAWITGRQPYGPLLLGFSVLQMTKADDPPDS